MCGAFCCNCGKCRGEKQQAPKEGECPSCGYMNEIDMPRCVKCGAKLILPPGVVARKIEE